MWQAWVSLFSSRKFWMSILVIVAIIVAGVLVGMKKIPLEAFGATIIAICVAGGSVIAGIAYEDGQAKRMGNQVPKPTPEDKKE